MNRVYEQPELEHETWMDDTGILFVSSYCEVCDASTEKSFLPGVQERDHHGNMPDVTFNRILESIEKNHDCLEPLREVAQRRVDTERDEGEQQVAEEMLNLARLACRALGQEYTLDVGEAAAQIAQTEEDAT